MPGDAPLRIRGETAYPASVASSRVRVAAFAPFLRAQGVALEFSPGLTTEEYALLASDAAIARKALVLATSAARLARARDPADLLLVHRLRSLSPLPWLDPPRRVDVYDIDDALFLGAPALANRRFQWAKQEARRCIEYLRRARLVIAGNSYLADRAREHARSVEVVPTCIDPTRQPLRRHRPTDVVTVGWIGSQTTVPYLEPALRALASLNADGVRARLVVLGGATGAREPWIEHRRWSLEQEAAVLATFDIGIMPLPDTGWTRGKCGYKILQYFAAGVPAVASPVGVSARMVGDERGRLATSEREWRDALRQLIDDPQERQACGTAGREFVEREYSYQRWAPELGEMLRALAEQ